MSVIFSNVTGITIPDGEVQQIKDANSNVLWENKPDDLVLVTGATSYLTQLAITNYTYFTQYTGVACMTYFVRYTLSREDANYGIFSIDLDKTNYNYLYFVGHGDSASYPLNIYFLNSSYSVLQSFSVGADTTTTITLNSAVKSSMNTSKKFYLEFTFPTRRSGSVDTFSQIYNMTLKG